MTWVINEWYQAGDRVETVAPEGSFKTILGCWFSVCIASGNNCFGHKVKQGAVVIVDNETPIQNCLERHLDRFAQYFGYRGYSELPIYLYPFQKFYFDRKTARDELIKFITDKKPVYIRLDSLTSMFPITRQNKLNKNSSNLGGVLDRDLNEILRASTGCVTDLAVHTKKDIPKYNIDELKSLDIQLLVRGHGSIVGEGSDSALVLKKVSEHPNPTRFAVITRSRRTPIPMSTVYIELREQAYGYGNAYLEEIDPLSLPPSQEAKDIFKLLSDKFGDDVTSRAIVNNLALFSKPQIRLGIQELLVHKVIYPGDKPQSYQVKKKSQIVCNKYYWKELNT